jgi:hypothetical protein
MSIAIMLLPLNELLRKSNAFVTGLRQTMIGKRLSL